mmetsp:Transcript_82510/g.145625  ORF Transcript_82510/g.145625 Transcript_82510/m.145625 type:complete len:130 (+) Transcript_82510:2952-3341(+)
MSPSPDSGTGCSESRGASALSSESFDGENGTRPQQGRQLRLRRLLRRDCLPLGLALLHRFAASAAERAKSVSPCDIADAWGGGGSFRQPDQRLWDGPSLASSLCKAMCGASELNSLSKSLLRLRLLPLS